MKDKFILTLNTHTHTHAHTHAHNTHTHTHCWYLFFPVHCLLSFLPYSTIRPAVHSVCHEYIISNGCGLIMAHNCMLAERLSWLAPPKVSSCLLCCIETTPSSS